jgi:hypothetical protein
VGQAPGLALAHHQQYARQSVKRVFRIIPFVREIPRVQKSLVDRVPQLAGSKFMKFTDHPALKSVSGPIGQAGCDDGLDDPRPCPDRFDEFPVHPRIQMSRICWASSRGPFRFDQMSVHPPVPAFADIAHDTIHDDCINVAADSCLLRDGAPRRVEPFSFFIIIATPNLSFSMGLIDSRIYESEYRTCGHFYSCGWGLSTSHGLWGFLTEYILLADLSVEYSNASEPLEQYI